MENNENLGVEQIPVETPENVENPTEQIESPEQEQKIYTQKEFDAAVGRKKSRWEAKSKRDYEKRYEKHDAIISILKAGTGKQTEDEIIEHLKGFYGNQLPSTAAAPSYSEKDALTLGEYDAREIIQAGEEEVTEELERLAAIGPAGMTAREKEAFRHLAMHKQEETQAAQLRSLGIPKEVYTSQEFRDFAGMFNASTPVRTIFDLYQKQQPQKQVETVGSVKNTGTPENGVKDFYTPDDVDKLTPKDYDNPVVMQRVRESMLRWRK